MCVHVCVYMCEWEKERERGREELFLRVQFSQSAKPPQGHTVPQYTNNYTLVTLPSEKRCLCLSHSCSVPITHVGTYLLPTDRQLLFSLHQCVSILLLYLPCIYHVSVSVSVSVLCLCLYFSQTEIAPHCWLCLQITLTCTGTQYFCLPVKSVIMVLYLW